MRTSLCRICTKYIDEAMKNLKTKQIEEKKDLSLIERILVQEPDKKLAAILALDFILVGIDTVYCLLFCFYSYDIPVRFPWQFVRFCIK